MQEPTARWGDRPDLRAAFANRDVLIGTFTGLASPVASQLLAHTGFDVLCIDGEHSAIGPAEVEGLVRASDSGTAVPLVRVCAPGTEVARALDAGAAGIVFPRVDCAATASECASQTRYPPTGKRGSGPGRASGYGASTEEYVRWANNHIVAIAQVETSEGLAAVDEIAMVDGIDAILVGPNDLALSLGVDRGSQQHLEAIDAILAAAARAGKATAILCPPGEVASWLSKGVSLLLIQSDLALLRAAAVTAYTQAAEKRERHAREQDRD